MKNDSLIILLSRSYTHLSSLILLITLLSLLTSATGFSQPKSETEVLNLSGKKFEWMKKMKFDSLDAILDERLMYVHSNGWTESKKEVIDDIKSGKLRYNNVEVLESQARLYGKTAIVNGKGKFSVVMDGNALEINLYYTEVYVLNNKKWMLVSRHANRIQ